MSRGSEKEVEEEEVGSVEREKGGEDRSSKRRDVARDRRNGGKRPRRRSEVKEGGERKKEREKENRVRGTQLPLVLYSSSASEGRGARAQPPLKDNE